tara:strand:- start:119 stop:922 length:804 start_codon:yes stop_codon:yes gene_type:complete
MAKKKTKVEVEETPQVVESTTVKNKTVKPKWEVKDRHYYLLNNLTPLSYSIRTSNIFWFDEEKGYERELKYTSNQRTPFADEMVGDQRLEHVVFENGALHVPKTKTVLQRFLSLHPHNGVLFTEYKPEVEAAEEIDVLEMEADAILMARELDVDMAEAIMRVEIGSKVSNMSSKELKRDLLVFARNNPALFLELVADDNIQLRNFGIRAVETGIIKLSIDQRHFMWCSNDRKIMTVPFDEHPYSALAAWFKTDEGMEIYANIEKRLK